MIIDLICLTICIVIITDLSGFPQTVYRFISRLLTKGQLITDRGNLTILTCSFCQTHWLGLFYLLYNYSLSIRNYTIILGLAFMTVVIKDLLINIKDWLLKLINYPYDKRSI